MSSNRIWILLVRKYNDELTPEEQEELEQLLRQHQDTFELNESIARLKDLQVKKINTEADEAGSRQAIAAHLNLAPFVEADEAIAPAPSPRRYRKLVYLAAACGILVIIWWGMQKNNEPAAPALQNEVVTSTSKSKLRLPDGSTVILNRQSKLVYNKDFGVQHRSISLTGEAYFDIAHNSTAPLIVTAGPVKIKVTGTAFNVRAYGIDSTIETSLIRGSIEVSSADDPERVIRMRPNEKIVFSKVNTPAAITQPENYRRSFIQMNRIQPNPTDSTINEIVWVQDKLVFSREPFYSLAQKMERWYQVKFRFQDTISEQLSLTGSLEKETLTEALDALRQLTPFNYKVDSGIVTISRKINPIP
jgi:Fe2+-dicitrate sensor, membrane component